MKRCLCPARDFDSNALSESPKRRFILGSLLVLGMMSPFAKWALCNRLDDFLITLRYARNAATGLGPVFSAGEYCWGFTSPLQFLVGYVLCLCRLGEEAVPSLICLIGLLAIGSFALNLCYWVDRTLPILGVATSTLLTFSSVLMFECVGFDSIWALGFAAWGLTALSRNAYRTSGVLIGLAVLSRPDTFLLLCIIILYLGLSKRGRAPLSFGFPAFSLVIPWCLWSFWMYRVLLPNTLSVKMEQGSWDYLTFNQPFAQAMHRPFEWFPLLASNWFLLSFLLLLTLLFSVLRDRLRGSTASGPGSFVRALAPLFLFVLFALSHFVAYFAVLHVPSYPWYNVYITAALLAVLGYGAIRFSGLAETALRRRSADSISWTKIATVILALLALCLSSHAYWKHFFEGIPRDNPERWRYSGYKAAAEWINENSSIADVVDATEIGVLGWYCHRNIIDRGELTMKPQSLEDSGFRFAVRPVPHGKVPGPGTRIMALCRLVARFPTPIGSDVVVLQRNEESPPQSGLPSRRLAAGLTASEPGDQLGWNAD